ncbi:hypothetical protein LWI29_028046 [Acer saccharum]|uniref:Uncharacterized protein n=1 Tax=Acer saccharum TaxID=4024 RepID=A0AA39VJ74_ACESA|nr:hypothetical protein LWI29_028046 [Acer saccharum]
MGDGTGNLVAMGFSKDACRKALSKMIVLDELPFSFVEREGICHFCSVACPKFDPPSRTTIARDINKLYLDDKVMLKSMFSFNKKRVCLTTDCWTSIQNTNYMVITAHFIDSGWELHKRILNFYVVPNHKGETIGKIIEACLLGWGIKRVFMITIDNASANDVAIKYVRRKLSNWVADEIILEAQHYFQGEKKQDRTGGFTSSVKPSTVPRNVDGQWRPLSASTGMTGLANSLGGVLVTHSTEVLNACPMGVTLSGQNDFIGVSAGTSVGNKADMGPMQDNVGVTDNNSCHLHDVPLMFSEDTSGDALHVSGITNAVVSKAEVTYRVSVESGTVPPIQVSEPIKRKDIIALAIDVQPTRYIQTSFGIGYIQEVTLVIEE